MTKTIFFDFDGVVIDSLATWVRVVQQAQLELGVGRYPTIGDFRTIEDLSNLGMARHLGIADAFFQC